MKPAETRPYTFSVWAFTDREIDIVVDHVLQYNRGFSRPIDRRRVPRTVQEYGISRHLFIPGFVPGNNGRWYYSSSIIGGTFDTGSDTPVESLWRMVNPMIGPEGTVGYSINRDERWKTLNIWPLNERRDQRGQAYAARDRWDVLCRLAQHGYIWFDAAGTIWDIRTRPVADRWQPRLPQDTVAGGAQ